MLYTLLLACATHQGAAPETPPPIAWVSLGPDLPRLCVSQVPAAGRLPEKGQTWAAGVSALAAGYAVAQVGSAAVGALAEKPELLGRVLILVGLAEGIAIYGLIAAILIFNRLG